MKLTTRILLIGAALLLMPAAALAQVQTPVYCNASVPTPCNTASNPGNGTQGDPAWLAFGKVNSWGTQLGLFSNDPANEVLATPNGSIGIPSLRALVSADLPASLSTVTSVNGSTIPAAAGTLFGSSGAFTVGDCLEVASANPLEAKDAGAACSSGMVYPGAGIPDSTGTAWGTSYATTGSGDVVLSTSPTLVTPALGTPSALVLTNATGLPIAGLTGLGTGVGTALGVNTGSAGAFVVNGGALGTPSSGVGTNITGVDAASVGGFTLPCTVPTLVSGDYLTNNGSTCSWSAVSGSGITLQTNGTNNASQTALNLVGTGNVAVTNTTGGTVDIGPVSEPVNAQTGTSYTIATSDCGEQDTFDNASAIAVTVPQADGAFATCQVDLTDIGAGTATLTAATLSVPTQNTPTTSATGGTLSGATTTYYYTVTATNSYGQTPAGTQQSIALTPVSAPTAGTATTATTGGTGLAASTTYYMAVTATTPNGETVLSSVESVTTGTGTTNTVTANWTDVAGATGYNVYISTSTVTAGEATVAYQTAASTATSSTFTAVPSTTQTTPSANTAYSNTNSNTISWVAVTGATGYVVYRSTTSADFTNATSYAVSGGTTTSFLDTGATGTTATPPTTNTTNSTINGATTLPIAQNQQCTLNSDGTNWQVIGCTALSSSSFGSLTSGTNTTAAMTVGAGASLTTDGNLNILGSSTGYTTIKSGNGSATNYTATLPDASGQIAYSNESGQEWFGGQVFNGNLYFKGSATLLDEGTTFTLSGGTGACATTTALTGGNSIGSFECTGTTGSSSIVIALPTAPNGWFCAANDLTTTSNAIHESATTTTSCTLSGSVTADDVINFHASAY